MEVSWYSMICGKAWMGMMGWKNKGGERRLSPQI